MDDQGGLAWLFIEPSLDRRFIPHCLSRFIPDRLFCHRRLHSPRFPCGTIPVPDEYGPGGIDSSGTTAWFASPPALRLATRAVRKCRCGSVAKNGTIVPGRRAIPVGEIAAPAALDPADDHRSARPFLENMPDSLAKLLERPVFALHMDPSGNTSSTSPDRARPRLRATPARRGGRSSPERESDGRSDRAAAQRRDIVKDARHHGNVTG